MNIGKKKISRGNGIARRGGSRCSEERGGQGEWGGRRFWGRRVQGMSSKKETLRDLLARTHAPALGEEETWKKKKNRGEKFSRKKKFLPMRSRISCPEESKKGPEEKRERGSNQTGKVAYGEKVRG